MEAIARGQQRVLVVMATGTGKTFTAFQIIHRLHKSGAKKKILYLADRNILIDQTMVQDFKPFKKFMTKITLVGEGEEKIDSHTRYIWRYTTNWLEKRASQIRFWRCSQTSLI